MAKVIVLRPFVFSSPVVPGARNKIAKELKITPDRDPVSKDWVPTEVELPDDVAAHEWISEQFADGCIEHPDKTKARIAAVAAKQAQEVEANQRIIQQAEAAMARSSGATEVKAVREEDVEKELNTPVHELKPAQGKDVDTPVNPPKGNKGK